MPADKKKQLLKVLKKERPKIEKMTHNVVLIEQKKVSADLGMLRFEYYVNDQMEATGSFVFPIASGNEAQQSSWDKLSVGDSEYYALTLDIKAKSIAFLVKEFIRRSLEEGKIQDLLPFTGGK